MKRHVCLYTLIFNRRLKNLVTRARLSSCRQVLKLGFMLKVWQKIYWPDHHSKNCYMFYQKYISIAIFFQYSAFWFLYCFLFIFCSFSWTCQYFKRFYLNTNLDYAGHHTRNPSFWTRLEADDASNNKNVTKTMKTGRWGWDSTSAPHV